MYVCMYVYMEDVCTVCWMCVCTVCMYYVKVNLKQKDTEDTL